MAVNPQAGDHRTRKVEGRDFSTFGLEHKINCVPVDEAQDDLFNDYHRHLQASIMLPIVPPGFPNNEELPSPDVLDCGYGTGIWIDDLLNSELDDTYPEAEVVGIDIFPRQDDGVQVFTAVQRNLNVSLGIGRQRSFDLINSRFLVDGIDAGRWPSLIQEYKTLLKERGWLQMIELEWTFHSDNGHALPNLTEWSKAYSEALNPQTGIKRKPDIAQSLDRLVRFAGFELVTHEVHGIRLGGWPSNSGAIGAIDFVHGMLESLAIGLFERVPNYTAIRRRQVVKDAQDELRNTPNARIFQRLTVVYGRRPFSSSRR